MYMAVMNLPPAVIYMYMYVCMCGVLYTITICATVNYEQCYGVCIQVWVAFDIYVHVHVHTRV